MWLDTLGCHLSDWLLPNQLICMMEISKLSTNELNGSERIDCYKNNKENYEGLPRVILFNLIQINIDKNHDHEDEVLSKTIKKMMRMMIKMMLKIKMKLMIKMKIMVISIFQSYFYIFLHLVIST